jgi:hypothetical protein
MDLKAIINSILEESVARPMVGININDKHQDFTGQILRGEKTIETRPREVFPKELIGRRVGLIRTGKGKATLVGYGTIGKPVSYKSEEDFRKDYDKHKVEPMSKFDITLPKGKVGYPITDIKQVKPRVIKTIKQNGYSYRWFI